MTTAKHEAANHTRETAASVAVKLAELSDMKVAELRERYQEVFGVPSRSRNREYLYRKIAWRIQELAEGGLSPPALAKVEGAE